MQHARTTVTLTLLQTDNIVVRDPTYLLDSEEFKSTGAIFWNDFALTSHDNPIWELTGKTCMWESEFESGQMVINSTHSACVPLTTACTGS